MPQDPIPGRIAAVANAGFPADLLIPIAPITAPPERFSAKQAGKAPARWGDFGWARLGEWQLGCSPQERMEADAHACNAGLILGVPKAGRLYLAIDIDTEPNDDPASPELLLAAGIQSVAAKALTKAFKDPAWVRLTRPGRAAFLVSMPADAEPGRRSVALLLAPGRKPCGRIEILAKGQQVVLCGVHPHAGGIAIRWARRTAKGSLVQPCPSLDDAIPILPSRAAADALMATVLEALAAERGVTHVMRLSPANDGVPNGQPIPIEERLPWDVASFVRLFAEMPHDQRVTRDDYVTTMLAASACIRAAVEAEACSADEADAMRDAAIAWAARWEDPAGAGTDEARERDAWHEDFAERQVVHLGWMHLVRRAIALGNRDLRVEWAGHQFPLEDVPAPPRAVPGAPPMPPMAPGREGVPTPRRDQRVRFDIKSSEIQIADAIEGEIGHVCAWLLGERKWIAWGGHAMGWSHPHAEKHVRGWIEDALVRYVADHDAELGDSLDLKASLTAERRVTAIEKLLRMRLGRPSSEVDRGVGVLQTPAGAFDLATGGRLGWEEQRDLVERRLCGVAPAAGPTPRFDRLLLHLACQDQPTADWMRDYFSYAIVGMPLEHVMLVVHGPGGNGKTTLANVLMRVLGAYAWPIDRRVIAASGRNDHPTGLAEVAGRRLWCVSEIEPDERWNEASIKALSGGDPIKARGMRQDMGTIRAEGMFFVYTNFVPAFHRVDAAIVRRFRMVAARMKVEDGGGARELRFEDSIVAEEGPAVLASLMARARELLAEPDRKLPPVPAAMRGEAARWFAGQDMFHAWFSAECYAQPTAAGETISVDDLHKRYVMYAKRIAEATDGPRDAETDDLLPGAEAMSATAFASALRRAGGILEDGRGAILTDKAGRRVATGLRLRVVGVAA